MPPPRKFRAPALIKGTPNQIAQRGKANMRSSVQNPTWTLINYAKKFRARLLESAPHLRDPMYKLLVAAIVDAELLHLSLMRGLKRDGLVSPRTGELRKGVSEARQQLRAQLQFYQQAGLTPKSKIDIAELTKKARPVFDVAAFRAEAAAPAPGDEEVIEDEADGE
jgi:hypothetical protein